MKLLEYQAKWLFQQYSIPVPSGKAVTDAEEAFRTAGTFGRKMVVKAQVPVGGRGKAGGIKVGETPEEIKAFTEKMIGSDLKGCLVEKVLVEEAIDIAKEFYFSFTIDRSRGCAILISSTQGGVDIEETARTSPQHIQQTTVDSFIGFRPYQLGAFFTQAGLNKEQEKQVTALALNLYRMFVSLDANLVEINPLVITRDGKVYAADAKVDIDDNAQYRQKEVVDMLKGEMEKSVEHQAKQKGLSYIKLDGNIGCVVNGAGLAMATMDLVKLYGGTPANFLDIGGSSNPEKVKAAIALLKADPNVKVALFNIFGGITRCDDVARGIVAALAEVGQPFPIIVRLTGTNEEAAHQILKGTPLIFAETMVEAAKLAVERAK